MVNEMSGGFGHNSYSWIPGTGKYYEDYRKYYRSAVGVDPPRLEIGTYTVKFDLAGFKTVINEGIKVTVGFNAQINAVMAIRPLAERW